VLFRLAVPLSGFDPGSLGRIILLHTAGAANLRLLLALLPPGFHSAPAQIVLIGSSHKNAFLTDARYSTMISLRRYT
jgi:hypothetical protein